MDVMPAVVSAMRMTDLALNVCEWSDFALDFLPAALEDMEIKYDEVMCTCLATALIGKRLSFLLLALFLALLSPLPI
jgi:hypothetical protein